MTKTPELFSGVFVNFAGFPMNACRVKVARKRKRLDDSLSCKMGGLVEYTYFPFCLTLPFF